MSTALTSGSIVAGFRIVRLIGQGAGGTVYLAADADGRQIALKVPIAELARDERFRQRFLREAQIAAALDEPHVVPTVAVGEDDGTLYLAMAYIDGLDLREILRREGPLAPERAVDLIGQVAGALDAAHARGLVHRDVKPGNVLVARDRRRRARLPLRLRPRQAHLLGHEPHRRPEPRRHDRLHLPRADRGRRRSTRGRTSTRWAACSSSASPARRRSRARASSRPSTPTCTSRPRAPARSGRASPRPSTPSSRRPWRRRPTTASRAAARSRRRAAAALRGEAPPRRAPTRRRALWALAGVAVAALAAVAVVGVLVLRGGGEPAPARLAIPPKSLGLIDARSHEVVGGIPFSSQPWDVAFDAGEAWVLLGDERRVARVDIASRKVLSTTTLPVHAGRHRDGRRRRLGDRGRRRRARARSTARPARSRGGSPSRPGATGSRESHRHRVRSGLGLGGPRRPRRCASTPGAGRCSTASRPRWPRRPWSSPATTSGWRAPRTAGSSGSTRRRTGSRPSRRCTARSPTSRSDRNSVWVSIVPDDVVFRLSPDDGSVLATLPAGDGPSTLSAGDGRVDRRRRGPRDRPGEHGRDTRAAAHHRHAVGGPLPRRPAVGVGRRARARRIRRDGRDAPDPDGLRRHRPAPTRP